MPKSWLTRHSPPSKRRLPLSSMWILHPLASDDVQQLLEKMGVSESIATSARVIVQSLREGNASSESIVKLVVQALCHDEDLKNAETQGYLRGRNEVIAAASTPPDDKSPRPLNFPIYTKRSFWDK